jgi:hypothetical protein
VATCCSQGSRPTQVYVPECMFGLEWIGMRHIPQAGCSCLCGVTSALGSRSSFGCTFKKGGTMNTKRVAFLVLLGSMVVVPVAQAEIKHIEMRVEGMT